MSEEGVQLVRDLLEAFQHRDHERAFDFYDRDIEWDASNQSVLPPDIATVYRGHDGVRAYWRGWLSAWSDIEFEVQDVVDCGGEIVALIRNQRQWGRHSGVETEVPAYGLVFTVRAGKVVRWCAYPDQELGPRSGRAVGVSVSADVCEALI
jgi:ketosteroid isomerase-like protein